MKRIFVFLAVFSVLSLAPALSAKSKGRAVGIRMAGVDAAVHKLYHDPDQNGRPNLWIGAINLSPAVPGTSYQKMVMWPGTDEYVPMSGRWVVPAELAGKPLSMQLTNNEEFLDENGVPRPAGEARFGIEAISPSGQRTFAWTEVTLPVDSSVTLSSAVLKAVSNGSRVLLLSTVPAPPQVLLLMPEFPGAYIVSRDVSRTGEVEIPETWHGKLWVTVPIGYPEAECVTIPVDE